MYRTFQWSLVFAQYPTDTKNFQTALGTGEYYGYKRQNELFKSTKFKSLAWVSWKLRIAMGPLAHAAIKYAGFGSFKAVNSDRMLELIERYKDSNITDVTAEGFACHGRRYCHD